MSEKKKEYRETEFRDFKGEDAVDARFEYGGVTLIMKDGSEVFVPKKQLGRLGELIEADVRSLDVAGLLDRLHGSFVVFSCNKTEKGFWYCFRVTSCAYVPVRHRDVFSVVESVLAEFRVRIGRRRFMKFFRRSAMLFILEEWEGLFSGLVVSNANTGRDAIHLYVVVGKDYGDYVDYGLVNSYVVVRHVGDVSKVREKLVIATRKAVAAALRDLDGVRQRVKELKRVPVSKAKLEKVWEYLSKRISGKSLGKTKYIVRGVMTSLGYTLFGLWVGLSVAGHVVSKSNLSDGARISSLAKFIYSRGFAFFEG